MYTANGERGIDITGCAGFFNEMLRLRAEGKRAGIYSVCSANPFVLQAAMEQNASDGAPVLIEATSNQVNQFGGYTGMTPKAFSDFVYKIAFGCGFPKERILLGGDHLGPLTWKAKSEAEAMALAEELVAEYVSAGFTKIHLDTSMKLASDDLYAPLGDSVIAKRGARLCYAAEQAYRELTRDNPEADAPVYVIGSEVPTPGGPQEEVDSLSPTTPQAFLASYNAFRRAFDEIDLQEAFGRVVAFVVQPGVEFTGDEVFDYDRGAAVPLCGALKGIEKPLVFEGHSTDYQTPDSLRKLVEDGVAILKVGPALTFALREGLVALENIERELLNGIGRTPSNFSNVLETAMLHDDGNWKNHYKGDDAQLCLQRKYSFFDRSRYYLPTPEVNAAIERLINNLEKTGIPLPMLSQYLPKSFTHVRAGLVSPTPRELLKDCIKQCLSGYSLATVTK